MSRPLALAAVLALAALPAAAGPPRPTLRLTLEPRAAPVPALRYYLLPQVRDRDRGNALFHYYRAFSPEWQLHFRDPNYLNRVADANDRPLRDLSAAQIDTLARGYYAPMLEEVDRGARRSYCDWELNDRIKEEGIGLRLPDVQGFRPFASLLKVRARKELLAGQYAQAARTLQTGLGLARDAAEGPTLIHNLVGIACAQVTLSIVDDWIDRPGAPNLYWALTDLPRPLIPVRKGLEGERFYIDWLFPGYRDLLNDPGSPVPTARVRTTLHNLVAAMDLKGASRTLEPLMIALKAYPRAKRFLRENGHSARQVEAMPALQAVFLYEVHQYDVAFDELRKWASLPYAEAAPHLRKTLERFRAGSKDSSRGTVAALLLPALHKVVVAQVRADRKVAALRCVEALRLYAAAHGGKWPARLGDVTEVPIPLDPLTGKPFEYRPDGDRATLIGPTPAGEKANASNTLRYELTLRTAKKEK